MNSLKDICADEKIKIIDGIKKLDSAGEKILLITNHQKLVGIVTDGDIRRWILKNGDLEANIAELMHKCPRTVKIGETQKAKKLMQDCLIEAVPVVDNDNILVDIIFWRDLIGSSRKKYENIHIPVVIMAGGKGTRLHPYTNVLPKPLIPIGNMTILEHIIKSFQKNGCNNFWLTLNYKKDLIKAYFDNKEKDYQINYVEEKEFQGTCGSIRLLESEMENTFFVSNCDVLLDIDYGELLRFHRESKNEITVVTALRHIQMPYGVMELEDGGYIRKIIEKPEMSYNVNTGIYVMEPTIMNDIPHEGIFHMTDLMNKLIESQRRIGAFPVTEQVWKDMGEFGEMQKMADSFKNS